MTNYLKALTSPSSVALIGASDNPASLNARPLLFLRQHGFKGAIYPVNPRRTSVLGMDAYASVAAIPEPVDHAYIMVGTDRVDAALQDCARAGVKVVSILADGFAESGADGLQRQRELADTARAAGMLMIGPNSMGVVDTRSGFCATTNAAFKAERLCRGRLAVISQSGSLIGTLLSRGQARGVSFSTFVSVGNEASADVGEIGAILLQDRDIDGFVLFLETIRNPRTLAEFAHRAYESGKPVVAYRLGESDEGQLLAVSHTGALTGNRAAADAYLQACGIYRVSQFDALFEAPAVLMQKARLGNRPKRVTVVATTGGGGAMAIDQLSLRGVEIAACPSGVRERLSAQGIALGSGKLIDVTLAGARYEAMKAVVSELINDPQTGVVLVAIGSSAQFNPELAVTPVVDAVAESGPNAAALFGFPIPHAEDSIRLLEAGGIPAFRTVESCADCLSLLLASRAPQGCAAGRLPAAAQKLIDRADSGVSSEVIAGEIFASLGVSAPAQVVLPADAIEPAVAGLAFPVVAKLVSSDIAHKSEAGAVQTGIANRAELADAISTMRSAVAQSMPAARIEHILLQQQCAGLGEALVGLSRDPLVGPVVTLAAGGLMTEIYRDAAVRPAPVTLATAEEMVGEIRAFALLRGYRGRPLGDLPALAAAVVAVSQLAEAPDIEEAEINPLLVNRKGAGVVMLDALIRKA